MNTYNAVQKNNMSFTANGYVRQAITFAANASQMLTTPFIPLSSTSFTVDTWLYITGLQIKQNHGIFSLCYNTTNFMCLHLTIRLNNVSYHLYLGFFGSDCEGVTPLVLDTWIHAAFVFDLITLKQHVYLNGVLENSCNVSSPIVAPPTNITIGFVPLLTVFNSMAYFQVSYCLCNSESISSTIQFRSFDQKLFSYFSKL